MSVRLGMSRRVRHKRKSKLPPVRGVDGESQGTCCVPPTEKRATLAQRPTFARKAHTLINAKTAGTVCTNRIEVWTVIAP